MLAVTVEAETMVISTPETTSIAAIDTGTTLVGGPAALIARIFAAIPGSAPGTGNYANYYTYRASSAFFLSLVVVVLT